jgi:2-(1,2-epoxy-1,2-dihydrophenyl)acetyl-CoA isomerase
MTHYNAITIERLNSVAVIELNRPDAANCINEEMATELANATNMLDADETVRAVVLTAKGRFFCAGGDVKAMSAFADKATERIKHLADNAHRAISALARMKAPVLVAVNGVTAGGGMGLAMAGDLVLAAESATFTMAYTKAGLSPDGSTTYFLPRYIGLRRLQELLFTNRVLSAEEAQDWRMVTRVVPDAALRAEALTLAATLADGPLNSHAAIKQLLLTSFQNGLETQMEIEGRLIARAAGASEGQEGIRAFSERRPPRFARTSMP